MSTTFFTFDLLPVAAAAAGLVALYYAPTGWRRLQLSRAKHPSLAGQGRE